MNNYEVIFVYDSMALMGETSFKEKAIGVSQSDVAATVAKQLERNKFIEYPGGLIPVSCIGEILIKRVD